jgi:hypothetical protein
VPQGAATTLYGALAPQLANFSGAYLDDCDLGLAVSRAPHRRFLIPFSCLPGRTTPEGTDASGEIRKALWKATEDQIRVVMAK